LRQAIAVPDYEYPLAATCTLWFDEGSLNRSRCSSDHDIRWQQTRFMPA
jgi:hypothetical protein